MPLGVDRWIASIVALTILSSAAQAANDVWDNSPGVNWDTGANWVDGTAPGNNDSATFNLAQAYNVIIANDPAVIQALAVTAGTVTLRSSGGARTLNLTAGAGSQDLLVSGGSTTLTLGAADSPVHLVAGDDLSIQGGATLAVVFGSDVVANDLAAPGLNGTLRVDGSGSTLTLNGTIASLIGASGTGSLVFQNGSTGNTILGALGIGNSPTPSVTGNLSVLSGSTLALGGNLTLSNQNLTGQVGNLTINGTNSALTQSGATTITVGSATNGTGTIAIGTNSSGGTLNTGSGLVTINKTGTVTIGGGANSGSLFLGGDLTINGGLLQKSSAASTFDLAEGKTVTIQGGGRLMHAGAFAADSNQILNIAGTNSRLEVTGVNPLTIGGGAQMNLTAGATIVAGGRIDVGVGAAGIGALSVSGSNSTATGGSELNVWANGGGTANVTFGNEAVGTFNAGIDLANSSVAGTTATVNVQTKAVLNTGNLNLATAGGTTTSATLNIQGTGSRVTQAAAAMLTVGHASEGTATINVGTTGDGGHLTTGSGLFKINKTGTVMIGSGTNGGTLEVLGNITVDGGLLAEGNDTSTFAWATGKTLTVQNGGRVHFASSYTSAASSQQVVTGANSRFEVVGAIQLRGAAQIGASAGGSVSAGQLNVGGGGTAGSLIVDGAGSLATSGGSENHWGNGGAATVTLSNQAAATFAGSLSLAGTANTLVNVISGADLTSGDLSLATIGGGASATLNLLGIGSTLTLTPTSNLVIGHATSGTATVTLQDGGAIGVGAGGTTTVNATGTMNLFSGSADLKTLAIVGGTINVGGGTLAFSSLTVNGGSIKFNSGRIEQTGNLTADENLLTTLFGPTHELGNGRTLAAGGGSANVSTRFDLNGGRLEGNSLNVTNTGLNATVLRIRNGGIGQFTGAATLAAGTTTFVEDNSSLIAGGQINQASELQLSGTGRIASATLANSALITGSGRIDANLQNQSSGQLRITANQRLLLNGTTHQNNGDVEVANGEFEVATGAFINGTTNPDTATIAARHASLRFSDGLSNAGSIICSEGSCNFFGDITNLSSMPTTGRVVITANSQATFFDNVVNHGTIQVSAAGTVESTALFLGSLSGNGVAGSGSVFLEGDVVPGAGIGTMAFGGDLSIGSSAVVKLELAGAGLNQFDRLTVVQLLAIGGELEIRLVSGFTPVLGQSFDLFDWGSRSGGFASIKLPALTGLSWNTSQLYTSGALNIAPAIPGDFNADGAVDGADYTIWRNGLGSQYTMDHYAIWKSHFGQSSSGGAAATMPPTQGIPEPASLALLAIALALVVVRRHRIAPAIVCTVLLMPMQTASGGVTGTSYRLQYDAHVRIGSNLNIETHQGVAVFDTASTEVLGNGFVVIPPFEPARPISVSESDTAATNGQSRLVFDIRAKPDADPDVFANPLDLDFPVQFVATLTWDDLAANERIFVDPTNPIAVQILGGNSIPPFPTPLARSTNGIGSLADPLQIQLDIDPRDVLFNNGRATIFVSYSREELPQVPDYFPDYNFSGVVDIADYTVWRNSFGQTGPDLAADGHHDNRVDAEDYHLWKTHFGESDGSSSARSSAVSPEPGSLILASLAIASRLILVRGARRTS